METKVEEKKHDKVEAEKKMEEKVEEKSEKHTDKAEKVEVLEEKKKEEKKEKKHKEKPKRYESFVRGINERISRKQGQDISKFIKRKKIDEAISELEEVVKHKRAIPQKGEIPHRKGPMMSGRYPKNASMVFIKLLKGLKGNSLAFGMELDKTIISESMVTWGSRPARRGGKKAKRAYIVIKAKEQEIKNG